jgi:hypothetical protein
MSRALLVLHTSADRAAAVNLIMSAPKGTRIEAKGARRSTDQNSLLWSLLTQVAAQKQHAGRRYTADQWKVLFMHACGREVQFIPSLDNATFIPWGQSSSKLDVQEMTDLIEFIFAWGAENEVRFREAEEAA